MSDEEILRQKMIPDVTEFARQAAKRRGVGFCIGCGVYVKDWEGLTCCPNCGSASVPAGSDNQVAVEINWHELHVLCCWAERWGHQECGGAGVVYSIVQRLRAQHPDKGPLTLAADIQQIVDEHPGTQTNIPGVEGAEPLNDE